jgi:branched-chain amino acid transport system ATP-binding protein
MAAVLALHDIEQRFAGVTAVNGVSFEIEPASLTGLIGPNGAGKTTLVNVAAGQILPTAGRVLLQGADVTRLPPHRRFEMGLARTFQSLRLYAGLTGFENLCGGALGARRSFRDVQAAALRLLDELGLGADRDALPGDLSFGRQKLLAIGRVLIARPRVVLMDEPFAGLTDEEIAALGTVLKTMARSGCAVLVIEHNLEALSEVVGHMVVLDNGKVIARGAPSAVLDLPEVGRAYFGGHQRTEVELALAGA